MVYCVGIKRLSLLFYLFKWTLKLYDGDDDDWLLMVTSGWFVCVDYGICCFSCVSVRILYFCVILYTLCVPSVLWYCWSGLLTCKTVSQITCTVLAEMLNTAQSINHLCLCVEDAAWYDTDKPSGQRSRRHSAWLCSAHRAGGCLQWCSRIPVKHWVGRGPDENTAEEPCVLLCKPVSLYWNQEV